MHGNDNGLARTKRAPVVITHPAQLIELSMSLKIDVKHVMNSPMVALSPEARRIGSLFASIQDKIQLSLMFKPNESISDMMSLPDCDDEGAKDGKKDYQEDG